MTIVLIAALLYLVAAGMLVRRLARETPVTGAAWAVPAVVAAILHGIAHLLAWRDLGGADLHFFSALSLVGLGMAVATLLFGARIACWIMAAASAIFLVMPAE